jgi:hypothetical protein
MTRWLFGPLVSTAIWVVVLASGCGAVWAQSASRLAQMQAVLRSEVRFQQAERVQLLAAEACPPWLASENDAWQCRRLKVHYRGVFLSGILLEQAASARTLAVYHTGHEAERQTVNSLSEVSIELVRGDAAEFVMDIAARGADVLVLFMPGLGLGPGDGDASLRRVHDLVSNHVVFSLLDHPADSAAAYFLAHQKMFLDRFGGRYSRIVLYGRSGGGWTATLGAAVEPRVNCSVSFFGTLPMQLRLPLPDEPFDALRDMGDFEQHGLHLYKRLDYIDLYAIASTPSRPHLQVYNEVDGCCFAGNKGRLVAGRVQAVYPNLRNFATAILPKRSADGNDHLNLDALARRTAFQSCPVQLGARPEG